MNSLFQDNGVGVGLRSTHHSNFLNEKPDSVSWLEVISENFMSWDTHAISKGTQALLKIRQDYPIALHGVSMNLGSTDPINKDYLHRLKNLMQLIDPIVMSDHISWTGVDGINLHDLMPIPYTKESLNLMTEKIDFVQNFLQRRILIENPSSYLEFNASEIPEEDFIAEILKRADCGILLDINNVYVSSVNHQFDAKKYLEKIPGDRIGQIHLAGHSIMDGYLIDTHDEPVCDEVWDLYTWAHKYFGPKSVMLERDDQIPDWNELEVEIKKIGKIYDDNKKSI